MNTQDTPSEWTLPWLEGGPQGFTVFADWSIWIAIAAVLLIGIAFYLNNRNP